MPTGAAHRYTDAEGGNLTAANVNSLDPGGNAYQHPTTALAVAVTALAYQNLVGATPVAGAYAGVASQSVTASQTNYLYLDSSGALAINTSGFPVLGAEAHIPLAEIVCDAVAITTITDRRPRITLGIGNQVPRYAVASLPTGSVGELAYATDGRKAGEGGGGGSGVLVFKDGSNWIAVDTGATVAA